MTELPDILAPRDARTLLVFGGAFDPPHRAHVDLPARAREASRLDWLLYVPAAHTPLKDAAPRASDEDRLRMLRLALEGKDRTSVTDLELRRGGASYTIDTLRELRRALPWIERMRLLIGADQAAKFHRWRSPGEVIALAEPLVLLRRPAESAPALLAEMAQHWPADELERWRSRVLELPVKDAASTDARRVLADLGPDAPALRDLIPAKVLAYIRDRGLYSPAKPGGAPDGRRPGA